MLQVVYDKGEVGEEITGNFMELCIAHTHFHCSLKKWNGELRSSSTML
jgi:hypothetical protein